MPASGSNRALRTLVGELAELRDGDLEAILADLEPGERDQLLELMAEYRDGERHPGKAPASDLALSQWLVDRLEGTVSSGMTPGAAAALQQSAIDAGWRTSLASRPKPDSQPGLRAWLGGRP